MEKSEKYNLNLLQRIADHLIINSSFLNNLGLFHGKMGAVIFFYHYSRFISNPIYEEFGGVLLDEILDEIDDQLPINFKNGYLGIGWGIEYLAFQKFINGNIGEILEEIDIKVMERDVRRISDLTLNTGLEGVLHYILLRIKNNLEDNIWLDNNYFTDLQKNVANISANFQPFDSIAILLNAYSHWMKSKKIEYEPEIALKNFYLSRIPNNNKVYECELGLIGGCAGIGMSLM